MTLPGLPKSPKPPTPGAVLRVLLRIEPQLDRLRDHHGAACVCILCDAQYYVMKAKQAYRGPGWETLGRQQCAPLEGSP